MPRSESMRSSTKRSTHCVSGFQRTRMPLSRRCPGSSRSHRSGGSSTWPSASRTNMRAACHERRATCRERLSTMSADITPFRIEIPEGDLDDLRDRLRRTRWPDAETVDGWEQGVPLSYVQEVCQYWGDKYDWRATEAR